jgi:putative endonuclease
MSGRYFVYVLRSRQDGSLYVGSTNNVTTTLIRHNKGEYRYTKGHRPWEAVYQENFSNRSEAVKRERFLKTGIGRQELEKFR